MPIEKTFCSDCAPWLILKKAYVFEVISVNSSAVFKLGSSYAGLTYRTVFNAAV